ncbi:MAG: hypothetical protein MUC76_01750 [Spirochaetes bacterium]|jgi:hypothetical protein|nr:hypothetical protein [Spirochaetota bacterium]
MSKPVVIRGISRAVVIVLVSAAVLFCPAEGPVVREFSLGSRLEPGGAIADGSLIYRLRPFRKKGTNKDLFNHIYFQGDTVCFSLLLSRPVPHEKVQAWFVDPVTGRRFAVERLDVEKKRVSGFSLAGSLLDDFHRDDRNDPVRGDHFCCTPIRFEVRVTLADEKGGYSVSKGSSFTIEYDDRQER